MNLKGNSEGNVSCHGLFMSCVCKLLEIVAVACEKQTKLFRYFDTERPCAIWCLPFS